MCPHCPVRAGRAIDERAIHEWPLHIAVRQTACTCHSGRPPIRRGNQMVSGLAVRCRSPCQADSESMLRKGNSKNAPRLNPLEAGHSFRLIIETAKKMNHVRLNPLEAGHSFRHSKKMSFLSGLRLNPLEAGHSFRPRAVEKIFRLCRSQSPRSGA